MPIHAGQIRCDPGEALAAEGHDVDLVAREMAALNATIHVELDQQSGELIVRRVACPRGHSAYSTT